jgi:geranylgeranyl diphosphate synthase type I
VLNTALQDLLPAIDAELRARLPAASLTPLLARMLEYHLGWRDAQGQPATLDAGKRLRPVLCLLCCQASGGDWTTALPAAAAVELLHNFTLIHDDIQDRSPERRHRATVWALWGTAQAINAGDALHAIAHQAVLGLAERGVPAERVLAAARTLTTACLQIVDGQVRDLQFETQSAVSLDDYRAMIARKTAALIGAACALGALVGGAGADRIAAYQTFGEQLGLGFQIVDDILGIWGEAHRTGKPAADDLYKHKKTLPLLYALQTAPPDDARRLRALLHKPDLSADEVTAIIAILDACGAQAFARAEARRARDAALRALAQADPLEPARSALWAMADRLVERDH